MGLQTRTRTAGDVMTHVKRQFGDESQVQVTDEDLLRWINDGQLDIASKNRVITAVATTPAVADQASYDFSTENVIEIDSIHYGTRRIPFFNFVDAEEKIEHDDPLRTAIGEPALWYSYAGQVHFWPTPDVNNLDTIKIYFIKAPAPVTSSLDTLGLPDKYYTLLCGYVVAQAYEMDEDWDASSNKLQQVNQSLTAMSEEEANLAASTYPTMTVWDY